MSKSASASIVAASRPPQSSASSAAASFTETVRGVKTYRLGASSCSNCTVANALSALFVGRRAAKPCVAVGNGAPNRQLTTAADDISAGSSLSVAGAALGIGPPVPITSRVEPPIGQPVTLPALGILPVRRGAAVRDGGGEFSTANMSDPCKERHGSARRKTHQDEKQQQQWLQLPVGALLQSAQGRFHPRHHAVEPHQMH